LAKNVLARSGQVALVTIGESRSAWVCDLGVQVPFREHDLALDPAATRPRDRLRGPGPAAAVLARSIRQGEGLEPLTRRLVVGVAAWAHPEQPRRLRCSDQRGKSLPGTAGVPEPSRPSRRQGRTGFLIRLVVAAPARRSAYDRQDGGPRGTEPVAAS
jgi:hypothetical protein